ncbi:response regulator [Spirosoma taeanense]|uniref:Response regulator n=1 Tax=Spirosoma taeanense TaxID=2735870 RepID=A0A6M5Y8I1_9BACT|nr:response regulator [Spirosoma taeanense]QJW89062.1 response regulator [Spirosoma taeanense]
MNSSNRTNSSRGRMLVVEDNPDHWELIQAASREAMPTVDVIWATDAKQALAYLQSCLATQLPKLMLLDLYLPDAEQSWQLLKTLKQRESAYQRMPVVVFSYSDRREDITDFYSFGGTSYIIKPTNYEQWVTYLQTVWLYWWDTVTLPTTR